MHEFKFFAEPNDSWHAIASGNSYFVREIRMFVTVEENQVNHW